MTLALAGRERGGHSMLTIEELLEVDKQLRGITPGNWEIGRSDSMGAMQPLTEDRSDATTDGTAYWINSGDGTAVVGPVGYEDGGIISYADARLIAAAPELARLAIGLHEQLTAAEAKAERYREALGHIAHDWDVPSSEASWQTGGLPYGHQQAIDLARAVLALAGEGA